MPEALPSPLLAHRLIGAHADAARELVVFLHGILGRGDNWQRIAQQLNAARPELGAVLVDLRAHGASQGFPPPHTLAAATRDVAELLHALGARARVVIGHSFGGKVALGLLSQPPENVQQLWVLDASPSARAERAATDTTRRVIEALSSLPQSWTSRTAFVSALESNAIEKTLGQWLAKNLVRGPDGLRFSLDLGAIRALLADYDRVDLWPELEIVRDKPQVRFVLAGRSSAVSEADRARLAALAERGMLEVSTLAAAGHWVHTDDPEGLLRVLLAPAPHGLP